MSKADARVGYQGNRETLHATSIIADAITLLGSAIFTIGGYEVVRMPDVSTQLHAGRKVAFLGVGGVHVRATVRGDDASRRARRPHHRGS